MSVRIPNRRQFLSGLAAALMAQKLGERSSRADAPPPAPAKSLIVLWMNGGPSHIDTLDPKKDGGPFSSIATRAPAIRICEHLPRVAEQADKLAIIRSMTSNEGNHERARQLGHTGYTPNPTVAHPAFGAWISSKAERRSLPSFVSIAGPSAGPGFLGMEHAPLVVRQAGEPPDNVRLGFGVDEPRFDRRCEDLAFLNDGFAARVHDPALASRRGVFERAVRLMRAPELAAFSLDGEPEAMRRRYGDSDFGRGCLLARRLVEAGVAVVEVTLDGWDTHQDNFERSRTLMQTLDPAWSSLLAELSERNLLDSTLVVWMGEFGRTPAINGREGRDHHPRAYSVALAGGGLRRGVVVGATDERGDRVVKDSVRVADLYATLAVRLGLEPDEVAFSPGGRPIGITDKGKPIAALLA